MPKYIELSDFSCQGSAPEEVRRRTTVERGDQNDQQPAQLPCEESFWGARGGGGGTQVAGEVTSDSGSS